MSELNERLRILRKDHLKLTQSEFADKIGIKGSTISDIEKGRRELTERNLIAICEKFNVSEEWLRTGEGEPINQPSRNAKLMMWAAEVLKDEDTSFRKGFVEILSSLETKDWITLAKLASLRLDIGDFETLSKITAQLNELSEKIKGNKKEED